MREKDYRKLHECEFPIMERLITEKEIFQKRLENKPIMVYTSSATKEQKDDMIETFWRTGVYRPMSLEDWENNMHGMNAVVTHHVNDKCSNYATSYHNWKQTRVGTKFRISYDEWVRRYEDWCLKINK
jgi:hypothetical protein